MKTIVSPEIIELIEAPHYLPAVLTNFNSGSINFEYEISQAMAPGESYTKEHFNTTKNRMTSGTLEETPLTGH